VEVWMDWRTPRVKTSGIFERFEFSGEFCDKFEGFEELKQCAAISLSGRFLKHLAVTFD
jgi:hypothetical protein